MSRPSSLARRSPAPFAVAALASLPLLACQDLSRYSTDSSRQYVGCVVPAGFVLSGVAPTTQLCMTLDANHLQDSPGALSSSDGLFASTPLRPIPALWNDPLSTFNFGEGRTKNLLYAATPVAPDGGVVGDVTVVVSLLSDGDVEVRLLRSAPPLAASADASAPSGSATATSSPTAPIFAVFPLSLQQGACAALSAQACTTGM